MKLSTYKYSSPLGLLKISVSQKGIRTITFSNSENNTETEPLNSNISQIDEYFNGKLKSFSLDIDMVGSEFQKKVWKELLKVPFGRTITYAQLASRLGDPKCIRAAAAANGANPIPVVIPCHRVIGSNGSLTGYAGGLWRKQWLLEHESAGIQKRLFE